MKQIDVSGGVEVAGAVVQFANAVKLLGKLITLDSTLSFDRHVVEIARSCNYHIRALSQIRRRLTFDWAKSVACSIVGSRLDYCNSLLYGTTQSNIDRLQRV